MSARKLLPLAVMVAAMASCQIDEAPAGPSGDDVRKVSFSIAPLSVDGELPQTKTAVTLKDGKRQITWADGDTVGIYPDTGGQVYFAIDGGAGSASSTFDGGGWEFKSSAVYRSYYPFIGDMYLDRKNIPVDFSGQKQTGNGNSSHIAPYTYMYTPGTSAEGGSLAFDYKHLTCVLVPTLTVPAGHYTRITLSLGEGEDLFMVRGHYDLSSDTPGLAGDEYSSSITLDLDVTVEDEGDGNGKLTAYIVTAPLDMSGKTLLLEVMDEYCQKYHASRNPTKAYTPGTIYTLTNTPTLIPFNEIWYILSDDHDTRLSYNLKGVAGSVGRDITIIGSKIYYVLRFENPIEEIPAGLFQGVKLSDIILPSTVKSIGDHAFSNCYLTSISLPSGVTTIEKFAFAKNNFTELALPSALTTIGSYAFYNNTSLRSVTFGPNVTKIGDSAFQYVPLESLELPQSLITIGNMVFGSTATFSTVNIPSGLVNFSGNPFCFSDISPIVSFTGESDLISEDGRCLIDDEGRLISFASGGLKGENYTLPAEVKIIGSNALAFAGSQIGSYTFPTAHAPEIESDNKSFSLLPSSTIRIRIPGASLPSTTLDEGSTGFNKSEEWLKFKKQFVLYQADNEIWYHNTDDKEGVIQKLF